MILGFFDGFCHQTHPLFRGEMIELYQKVSHGIRFCFPRIIEWCFALCTKDWFAEFIREIRSIRVGRDVLVLRIHNIIRRIKVGLNWMAMSCKFKHRFPYVDVNEQARINIHVSKAVL